METISKRLLLIGCSQRKNNLLGKVPAWELYDGVNFRVIKKAIRQGIDTRALDIYIISAKYGLISWNSPIENYDLQMTNQRALELQSNVSCGLDNIINETKYNYIFINMGKIYIKSIYCSKNISNASNVVYATGGIGEKMAQMKQWLQSIR